MVKINPETEPSGPVVLISPFLNETFPKLFGHLGITPLWSRDPEELARLARESPPDAALEWQQANMDATPVKDLVDLLGIDCPVLLFQNCGPEFQRQMMELGYDGMVQYPNGDFHDLPREIHEAIENHRSASGQNS